MLIFITLKLCQYLYGVPIDGEVLAIAFAASMFEIIFVTGLIVINLPDLPILKELTQYLRIKITKKSIKNYRPYDEVKVNKYSDYTYIELIKAGEVVHVEQMKNEDLQ